MASNVVQDATDTNMDWKTVSYTKGRQNKSGAQSQKAVYVSLWGNLPSVL